MMVPDAEISGVLQRLKAATRAEHDAIEATLDLMSPGLSLTDYRRRLRRYHGFYAPIEPLIAAAADWPHWGLDMTARAKTAWLDADLACLGDRGELGEVAPGALPLCRALPPLDTPAAAFGCVYVLEGATLGGRVISRHIERVLGLDATHGARFFHGYGEHTGALWKAFRCALSAFADNPTGEEKMVESAIATFAALRAWCAADEPNHEPFADGALRISRYPLQSSR
jgi:heme oxygenase